MPCESEIREVLSRRAAVMRLTATVADMGEKLGTAFGEVMQFLMQSVAPAWGPVFAYYGRLGEGRFDVSAGFI